MDERTWRPTVFTRHRNRPVNMSDKHLTVDGALIDAWASQKSFQRKGRRS
jgi:hypothetical protein